MWDIMLRAVTSPQGVRARSFDEEEDPAPCVFDSPEGEPTCIFVNPFACNISPLDWRLLQVCLASFCFRQQARPRCTTVPLHNYYYRRPPADQ